MESKFQFLVDRSSPFGPEKAQILDEFTLAIKNNTAQVSMSQFRVRRQTICGDD